MRNETREQTIERIANDVQLLNGCRWSEALAIATEIWNDNHPEVAEEIGGAK